MRIIQRILFFFLFVALLCGCVQTYVSPYKSPPTGYLVVEGYISGNSVTQYSLTRTIGLPGDSTIPIVSGAQVQVEGNDNSVYPLPETATGTGIYGTDTLTLNPAAQFRLRITIPGGETYLSAFVPYKPTPAIDSINWVYNSNGVTIYANTHDPANNTRYYQWSYVQTWEYESAAQSLYIYQASTGSVVPRESSQQNFQCWMTNPATNIMIGSSAKLAQDVIYEFPLVYIAPNTQPLSILYTIQVQQYALTEDGYNFLALMQSNTEALGSIFDVQPSEITGNIQSLSNPSEQVIGYISAGTVQQQRIFISEGQLPYWNYGYTCGDPDILVNPAPDSLAFYFGSGLYTPLSLNLGPSPPIGYYFANYTDCVDCTIQGGTTQKPSFWPN